MNRILKRPMFRIGGSSGTGITSGLDKPREQYQKVGDLIKILQQDKMPQFQRTIETYQDF